MADFADSPEFIASQAAGEKLMALLRAEFPEFEPAWQEHVAFCEGAPAGSYLDISVFARFIHDDLFERRQTATAERAFHLFEKTFLDGDEPTRDLIAIGFIEDLQNYSSSRNAGHARIVPLLPPVLMKVWKEIERQWAGHSSLADVIEAENRNSNETRAPTGPNQSKWADLINSIEG